MRLRCNTTARWWKFRTYIEAQPETEDGADVAMHRAVGGDARIFIRYLPSS